MVNLPSPCSRAIDSLVSDILHCKPDDHHKTIQKYAGTSISAGCGFHIRVLRLRAVAEKNAKKKTQGPTLTASETADVQRLRHYQYFPKKADAETARVRLCERGFQVEVRKGADGVNWLALASGASSENEHELERTREEMEEFASALGGEYDGWEIEVDTATKNNSIIN